VLKGLALESRSVVGEDGVLLVVGLDGCAEVLRLPRVVLRQVLLLPKRDGEEGPATVVVCGHVLVFVDARGVARLALVDDGALEVLGSLHFVAIVHNHLLFMQRMRESALVHFPVGILLLLKQAFALYL